MSPAVRFSTSCLCLQQLFLTYSRKPPPRRYAAVYPATRGALILWRVNIDALLVSSYFRARPTERLNMSLALSVCGEPCSRQKCPQCASHSDLNQVVDLILQQTLGEVRDAGEDDMPLVTLQCGHIFTVETLDGHTHLEEHYRRDLMTGRWLGLKQYQPPTGLTAMPRCPNCRTDVDSPRYNRIAKRAKLDLMENNVANQLSRSLEAVRRIVSSFDSTAAKEKITSTAARVTITPLQPNTKTNIDMRKMKEALSTDRLRPVSLYDLEIAARVQMSSEWRTIVEPLRRAYREVIAIAAKPSAHRLAYEAAFAQLYRGELQDAEANKRPSPEQCAMRLAKIAIGQPKPLADLRYLVEASQTKLWQY